MSRFYNNPHWGRSHLRKGRCVLAFTLCLVVSALYFVYMQLALAGSFHLLVFGPDLLWNYPHLNQSDTTWPPHHPIYLVFQPNPLPPSNTALDSPRRLPLGCIDALFTSGQPCHAAPDPPLDVVWTWVNGSDRLIRESMAKIAVSKGPRYGFTSYSESQFFREHDELRHSIRSVLQYFRPYTKQMHIVTSDFSIPIPLKLGDTIYNNTRRLGLVPRWLNVSHADNWKDRDVQLDIRYHSEMFYAHNSSSFNSYGIETQLVNLRGISDNFIYMNDDFYMMANLSSSDFYTSAYGTVFRMQANLLVKNSENPHASMGGEWGPLEYTNFLLGRRFGSRARPYTAHSAKSLSLPLMKEFSRIWEAELAATASHPFRGMVATNRDVYSMFLFAHFVVERWREGLLWSWAVAKIGGVGGEWGAPERAWAWRDVGGRSGDPVLHVQVTRRTGMDSGVVRETLRAAGHTMSGKTRYEFSSGDGYPYGYRNATGFQKWPSFTSPSAGELICKLDYRACFAGEYASASDFFKSIAFEENQRCGDCIVHALRAASGLSGLSAFLPDSKRKITTINPENGSGTEQSPYLPLISDWHNGDFSLHSVILSEGEINIREWTLRMLERYRFVIGDTPTIFHQISSVGGALTKLQKVDQSTDVALLCLNDDIMGTSRMVDQILVEWQERRWGRKADWEI